MEGANSFGDLEGRNLCAIASFLSVYEALGFFKLI